MLFSLCGSIMFSCERSEWSLWHSSLHWRHNGRDSVSNHQPHDCLLNRFFSRTSKKTSKLRVTGLCVGNSPGTGEFPTQMASNAEFFHLMTSSYVTVNSFLASSNRVDSDTFQPQRWHGSILGTSISTFNSLGPSDAIWRHRSRSTLAQVMACCLTASSHLLNQCWIIITKVQWCSSEGNFAWDITAISP